LSDFWRVCALGPLLPSTEPPSIEIEDNEPRDHDPLPDDAQKQLDAPIQVRFSFKISYRQKTFFGEIIKFLGTIFFFLENTKLVGTNNYCRPQDCQKAK